MVTSTIHSMKLKQDLTTRQMLCNNRSKTRIRDQPLLPGIPDELTIACIFPRLSWAMVHNLAAVSYGWLRAIQEGEVHEARVSSQLTHTVFVLRVELNLVYGSEAVQLAIYSVDDNSIYSIPPIPGLTSSTLHSFTYTSVNGKLYAIGTSRTEASSGETWWRHFTYVYDLVRHKGWRQRTTDTFVYKHDDCAVMNGKIFVYGWAGPTNLSAKRCAIYDPDADVWSPIFKNTNGHQNNVIRGIQEDLVYRHSPLYLLFTHAKWIEYFEDGLFVGRHPYFCSMRNPGPDVQSAGWMLVTMVGGRFLKMTHERIDVYDSQTNTRTPFHFQGPFEFEFDDAELPNISGLSKSEVRRIESSSSKAMDVAVVSMKNIIFSVVERRSCLGLPNAIYLMKSEIALDNREDISIQPDDWQVSSQAYQNIVRRWERIGCNLRLFGGFLRCPLEL